MKRRFALLLGSAAAGALLAVSAAFAGPPNGQGLFGSHESSCTGAFTYAGLVTLVPGAGNSFWVDGHHLVIQSVFVDYDDEALVDSTYTFGQKTGKASETVTCTGHFDAGYTVTSTDLIVP